MQQFKSHSPLKMEIDAIKPCILFKPPQPHFLIWLNWLHRFKALEKQ